MCARLGGGVLRCLAQCVQEAMNYELSYRLSHFPSHLEVMHSLFLRNHTPHTTSLLPPVPLDPPLLPLLHKHSLDDDLLSPFPLAPPSSFPPQFSHARIPVLRALLAACGASLRPGISVCYTLSTGTFCEKLVLRVDLLVLSLLRLLCISAVTGAWRRSCRVLVNLGWPCRVLLISEVVVCYTVSYPYTMTVYCRLDMFLRLHHGITDLYTYRVDGHPAPQPILFSSNLISRRKSCTCRCALPALVELALLSRVKVSSRTFDALVSVGNRLSSILSTLSL